MENWEFYYDSIFKYESVTTETILLHDARHPSLDAEVTLDELELALNSCKRRKAAGMDSIPNEFLMHLPENAKLFLLCLFNKILLNRVTPASWSQVIFSMLLKSGDPNVVENYRNIALVNSIAKVFTRILYNRLLSWCEGENILPECQSGFRPGRGCIDNVFVLSSAIQIQLRLKKRKVFCAFIDFMKAFDSIDHSRLWQKLWSQGISGQFIMTLSSLYDKATMQVKSAGNLSKTYAINKGVLQGELLSPLLFALFLADLEDFLRGRGCMA